MIRVGPSWTIYKLTYKDIIASEIIKEDVFEHESTTYEVEPHIVSRCNEKNKKDEDYDKDNYRDKIT